MMDIDIKIVEILSKTNSLDMISELIPGWLYLNSIHDFSITYMCPRMERECGISREIVYKSGKPIIDHFSHPETTNRVIPMIKDFIDRKDYNEILGLFQQVKTLNSDYNWYYTSLKLLEGTDCTIAITNKIDSFRDFNEKLETILNENIFIKSNLTKYDMLTIREKEIIPYLVLGKSHVQIADTLNISELTVKTHRQNIYKKLEISHVCDLIKFAGAFGIT